jgi:hypothetical protein
MRGNRGQRLARSRRGSWSEQVGKFDVSYHYMDGWLMAYV